MEPVSDSGASQPFWVFVLGYALMAIFVVSVTISGFIFGVRWGFLALGLSSGAAAYVIGSE